MATVSKEIADDIIAGKYEDDQPIKIVKYQNAWGGEAYGAMFKGDNPNRYEASKYVRNPTVYWEKS